MMDLLRAYWPELSDFFNSVFFTAIAGSLAGAFAGAYGAQRIAERAKYRDELLKEIRNTNAAIGLSFGVCNSLLSMKKQHVKALKENFANQKAALVEFHNRLNAGQIGPDTVFRFRADFETLSLVQLPVDVLQNLVIEKLSLAGRPLSLATTLSQVVHSLGMSHEKRNQLIEYYKATGTEISAHLYFGLPHGGHVNQDYPATITAIYNQTDDGIYFSNLLIKDLVDHGERVAAQFKKSFGKGASTIVTPDFTIAENAGLMPSADNYADWDRAFVKRATDQSEKAKEAS